MIDNATFQLLMSGGFISGFIILIFKMGKIAQKIDSMGTDIQEMKQDLRSIDGRLNRLEGAFQERGYWESRHTGTEERK